MCQPNVCSFFWGLPPWFWHSDLTSSLRKPASHLECTFSLIFHMRLVTKSCQFYSWNRFIILKCNYNHIIPLKLFQCFLTVYMKVNACASLTWNMKPRSLGLCLTSLATSPAMCTCTLCIIYLEQLKNSLTMPWSSSSSDSRNSMSRIPPPTL